MAASNHQEHWTPFVGGVVSDPAAPPDSLLLLGYLGASSEAGHTRLYFDPQLTQYVEIPDDAILHVETPPEESTDPLRATWVWVHRDAAVLRGPVAEDRTPSSFLEGPLVGGTGTESGSGTEMDTTTHPPGGVTNCHPPGYEPMDTHTHPPQGVTACHPPGYGEIDTGTHPPGGVTACHPHGYGPLDTTTHPPGGVTNCHAPGYGPMDTRTHPPAG